MKKYFIGIESGGTKFNLIVAKSPQDALANATFATESPKTTFRKIINWLNLSRKEKQFEIAGIGIGAFGPVNLDPKSVNYGHTFSTPKAGWTDVDVLGTIQNAFQVPVDIDTDVNCAALGERFWGAAQQIANFLYITIGTGIGGGLIINNQPVRGLMHPELGHIRIPHNNSEDPFPGNCPFHGDCFEGLASGPAIEERWNLPAKKLAVNSKAWDLEAKYIALALANYILTLSPERIILGGGVMQQAHLFPMIRAQVVTLLNGYLPVNQIIHETQDYIVPPGLGTRSGEFGAVALAIKCCKNH